MPTTKRRNLQVRFGHLQESEEWVVPVDFGVTWDGGAPIPHLVQSEHRAFLAFHLRNNDPAWDGSTVTVVSPHDTNPSQLGVIEWLRCGGAVLGGLNDDSFAGHPLWRRGLKDSPRRGQASGEVTGSAWVAEWMAADQSGDHRSTIPFKTFRHFILQFHDSTFECVARGFVSYRAGTTMAGLLRLLTQHLIDGTPLELEQVARQPAGDKV